MDESLVDPRATCQPRSVPESQVLWNFDLLVSLAVCGPRAAMSRWYIAAYVVVLHYKMLQRTGHDHITTHAHPPTHTHKERISYGGSDN